jgi:hypothetical protein
MDRTSAKVGGAMAAHNWGRTRRSNKNAHYNMICKDTDSNLTHRVTNFNAASRLLGVREEPKKRLPIPKQPRASA